MSDLEREIKAATILALMVEREGVLAGRLRVQKLMYLLQQKGVPELQPLFFKYHHYGPFSEDVVDVIRGSKSTGIVTEHETGDEERKRYDYKPGQRAALYAGRVPAASRAIVERVLEATKSAHWRVLELAATVDFLERADNIEREVAFREALERKPECAPFQERARELLAAIEL